MAQFTAGTAAELATAIVNANASSDAVNTIVITASIALTAALPILNPQAGTQLVISGGGFTIDGQNTHRIFFANSGEIAINNVTLANGLAKGGEGGTAVRRAVADLAPAVRSSSTTPRTSRSRTSPSPTTAPSAATAATAR